MRILSDYWDKFQVCLFPRLETALEQPLTEKLMRFIRTVDVVRIDRHVGSPYCQWMGRKVADRRCIARAFLAKAVFNLPTTQLLIEVLHLQPVLRQLCGFERVRDIPSASTFSRAFAEFASAGLGDVVHEALVKDHVGDKVVMHVSRDSTAVKAREKAAPRVQPVQKEKRKRGRPRADEYIEPKEPRRIAKQLTQDPEEALAMLPRVCDIGFKKDALSFPSRWRGWKLHIDWADGGVPLFAVTTSASLNDNQVAIPMSRITAQRAVSCYDLMDAAYDVKEIRQVSAELGHVPIIHPNSRYEREPINWEPDRQRRYKERTTAERGNSRLKDEFGADHLRVRGHAKTHMHLMFGIITLFADAMRYIRSG